MNIYDLISRAQKLRKETQLDSVSPDRVGGLHEDTLKYINEFQLLASSPSLHKIYASVSAMQSDKSPKSDLTGKPLKPGQLVVIVPANQTDATAGDVYRYDGPSGNTSAWTFVAKIGAVPADAELSATSTNPPQNKVVTEKLTELESSVAFFNVTESVPLASGYYSDLQSAALAVPVKFRKNGLIIAYAWNQYSWRYAQFFKVGVSSASMRDNSVWGNSVNWVQFGLIDNPFFATESVARYPHLGMFEFIAIEALTPYAKVPSLMSLAYINATNKNGSNQIIINFNHQTSETSKNQSLVINADAIDGITSFVKEQDDVRYTFVVNANKYTLAQANVQTNLEVWLDIVNYNFIPFTSQLEKSIIVNSNIFSKKFGKDFFVDCSIRGGEPDNYTYYPYIIDVDRDTEMPNVLSVARRDKNTGETENVLYLNVANYIDANGMVHYSGKANMTSASNVTISLLVDWNIARLYAKGERVAYYYNQASFSDIVYRGGLGISENKDFKRLREIDAFPVGSYNLCKKRVSKLIDTPTLIGTSYSDEGEGTIQAVKNLSAYSIGDGKKYEPIYSKRYVNLKRDLRFLDITPDGKIWFCNRNNNNLHYYNSVDDIYNGEVNNFNRVECGQFFDGQSPVSVKMNTRGELIVVVWNDSLGLGNANNAVRVFKSDSNFDNWRLVLTYNTIWEGMSYPDWSVKIEGDRILLSGYGNHTDVFENAIWNIYYSMDGGDTWYSRIFRLGELVDIDGWTPTDRKQLMHIHGVAIDMYRHRLMVMNGDTEVSLFVTTNLAEWEQNVNRADAWNPSNTDALHWKRLSVKDSMKYTSGIALPDCLILGTDACPNGFQRINISEEFNNLNECAMSNPQIAVQRTNADGTGDYAFYGYTLDKHSPSTPVICSLMYVGGVQPSDYKRNSVYVTDDGYTFSKIWEDDRDVVSFDGSTFTPLRPRTILTSRINKNGDVLIQTCDSRFNDLVNDYPAPTSDHTLVIGKLNM